MVSNQNLDQRRKLEQILSCYQYTEDATSDASSCQVSPELALRIYDILREIGDKVVKGERKPVGIGIAVGYEQNNYRHARDMDANYFDSMSCSVYDADIADKIAAASEAYDGGILIGYDGKVLKGGVKFIADDFDVLEEMAIPNGRGLSERFGFAEKIGTRHTSSIAASYRMPNTIIYVMSEESGQIRAFRQGKIINSSHPQEVEWPVVQVVREDPERRDYRSLPEGLSQVA